MYEWECKIDFFLTITQENRAESHVGLWNIKQPTIEYKDQIKNVILYKTD